MKIKSFDDSLKTATLYPLTSTTVKTLQVNIGRLCNQQCKHCHADGGPEREETMTHETMESCLAALEGSGIETVDITGGAPEMNPSYRWFVERLSALDISAMTRTNLTVFFEEGCADLPEFFARNDLEVTASLPCYTEENVDAQRGEGVFVKSIQALRDLNAVGYGDDERGLKLNLVYNPGGAGLPGSEAELERDYKTRLAEDYGIGFTKLFALTNLPVGRFKEKLQESGEYEEYMELLAGSFNPEAAERVMCREM
ncbi:MAG: arsenosugar biosynthesis radical SAM (seleno)protein ArsS, partial [Thermodesulfobacteriota bacterium]